MSAGSCARRAAGSTTRSITASAPATWASCIADNAKREAMKVPFLRDLLLTDSIYIGSNITFENLTPVSTYLGKPGDPGEGRAADRRPTASARTSSAGPRSRRCWTPPHFIERAERALRLSAFRLRHRRVDLRMGRSRRSGRPDPDRAVAAPAAGLDRGDRGAHRRAGPPLRPRAQADVLPAGLPDGGMGRLSAARERWRRTAVDPDAFVRWTYARALAHRQPRYGAMADRWGVTVPASALDGVTTEAAGHRRRRSRPGAT